jgi:glutaredoxin
MHASRVAAVPTITLYGKPGCHLCHEARDTVKRVIVGRDVALEEVDVSLDATLYARYGERIPVVEIDGEEAFEYVVDAGALEGRLDRVGA